MTMMANLRIGDWVEVRSKQEILETLDCRGRLDGMPFMPEMFAFCGQRFRIYKWAHKTCDYSTEPYTCRNLVDAVHLETRCGGEAHDGCQAACLLYWKLAWLKHLDRSVADSVSSANDRTGKVRETAKQTRPCNENDVWDNVREPGTDDATPTYVCQMTQIRSATTPLTWWDPRQYLKDYSSGNVTLGRMASGLVYWIFYSLSQAGIGVGRPMRWLYDLLCPLWGGSGVPRKAGLISDGLPTPTVNLNLQPG